jgi:hypothetical protein
MLLSTLVLAAAACGYLSLHEIQISAMLACVSSISGIAVLRHPQSWCTVKFTDCFVVSHSTAHNRGRAADFTNITFSKREFAANTLRKAKFVKTSLPNTFCSKRQIQSRPVVADLLTVSL